MPRCVKCKGMFPPNYVEVIPDSNPNLEGEYPKHCFFCKNNVDEVERETEHNSGKYIKYTKKQCLEDYRIFLAKLKDSKNVKDIMNKTNSSGIILN